MAVPTTYLTSTKNLGSILGAVQKAGVPPKFSYEFLKQLGFPSSNDRPLIPLFKSLGFIDPSGTPLERYRRLRDATQAGIVMAEGMRDAYADVFAVDQSADRLPGEELKGVFTRLSGKSDAVADKMALTFKALVAHSDFTATPTAAEPAHDFEPGELNLADSASNGATANPDRPARLPPPIGLHHDIHIHLPESSEIAVFDAIFRALRDNFG